jgi:hypothetical protein
LNTLGCFLVDIDLPCVCVPQSLSTIDVFIELVFVYVSDWDLSSIDHDKSWHPCLLVDLLSGSLKLNGMNNEIEILF